MSSSGDLRQDVSSNGEKQRGLIVGGEEVLKNDIYPYFVNLGACAGALIHGDIVLTAAHCTINIGSFAQVGAYERKSLKDDSVYVQIVEEISHPEYNPDTHEYDFRLLRLGGWVDKPVATLNSDPAIPGDENDPLTVIGMGRIQEDGNVSSTLLSTQIYQINTAECQALYPEFLVNDEVVICAAGDGRDSCDGDSAAPLLSESGSMLGLVSWGLGCARETRPGVYSRLSAGYDWIRESMCYLSMQRPTFCASLDFQNGLTKQIRVDVKYNSTSELPAWVLYDRDQNLLVNSTEQTFVGVGVLVSTYVPIFEFEVYMMETTNIQGALEVNVLQNDGSSTLITQASGNSTRTFIVTEAYGPVVLDSSTTVELPPEPNNGPTDGNQFLVTDRGVPPSFAPSISSNSNPALNKPSSPPIDVPSLNPSLKNIIQQAINGRIPVTTANQPSNYPTARPTPSPPTREPTQNPTRTIRRPSQSLNRKTQRPVANSNRRPLTNPNGRRPTPNQRNNNGSSRLDSSNIDSDTKMISLGVYVEVPRGENPLEVGWELIQGNDVVKRVSYGSYERVDLYFEEMFVRPGREFTFYMDMQNSNNGKARFEVNAWFNDDWHYLGGDKGERPGEVHSFPRTRTFLIG